MRHFPNCNISDANQRTDDWHKTRSGLLTASQMGAWLITRDSNKRAANAWKAARRKCLSGLTRCYEIPTFENDAMRRGTEMEPAARTAFEMATGLRVAQIGFCQPVKDPNGDRNDPANKWLFGCSPDGVIEGQNIGYESKCPTGAKHLGYVEDDTLPDEYTWQIQGSLAVTGALAWYFHSYHPGQANLILRIERDETTDAYRKALEDFSDDLEASRLWHQAKWKEQEKAARLRYPIA